MSGRWPKNVQEKSYDLFFWIESQCHVKWHESFDIGDGSSGRVGLQEELYNVLGGVTDCNVQWRVSVQILSCKSLRTGLNHGLYDSRVGIAPE
jgi:hypothetical protein